MNERDAGSQLKKAARRRTGHRAAGLLNCLHNELLKWWGGTAFNPTHRADRDMSMSCAMDWTGVNDRDFTGLSLKRRLIHLAWLQEFHF
jgi:hypothetical protein